MSYNKFHILFYYDRKHSHSKEFYKNVNIFRRYKNRIAFVVQIRLPYSVYEMLYDLRSCAYLNNKLIEISVASKLPYLHFLSRFLFLF